MSFKLKSDIHNIVVGACVCAVVVGYMAYGYVTDKSSTYDGGYPLVAKFRSIDGISEGSAVRVAGIDIGTVSGEVFDPINNNAVLELTIDPEIQLPYDSVAMIVSEGIFGGKFIKIAPGGEFDMLEPGDEFEFVQDSVIFEELLEKVILAAEAKRRAEKSE